MFIFAYDLQPEVSKEIMKNIILADNQDITRAGWYYIIQNSIKDTQIDEAHSKKELFQLLVRQPESLIILDYTLFDFESVEEMLILQSRYNQSNWLLFSDELSTEFIRYILFNTSAFSIVLKDSSYNEIENALKDAVNNLRHLSNEVTNILIDSTKNINQLKGKTHLTTTEKEILKDMAIGKTTREIASSRNVSIYTIMTHRKNIFRKIEVNNVHEATKYAIRAGIIDVADYYI